MAEGGTRSDAMNEAIVHAIQNMRRLRLVYHGKTRIAEPQCYGIGTSGSELLRIHQIRGGAQCERLFTVSEIEDIVELDEVFTKPGPNYKKNDSAMKTIFCQL
jgi:hypothetical protein